jgi:Smg protein
MEKTEAIEILDYMFEFLFTSAKEGTETEIDDSAVKKYLSDAGFESAQIDNALEYLQGMAEEISVQTFNTQTNGLRIYSTEEKQKLGTKAFGVLTYLDSNKSINPIMREMVAEQVMDLPYECEFDELMWIIESAALNLDSQSLPFELGDSDYQGDKDGTRH